MARKITVSLLLGAFLYFMPAYGDNYTQSQQIDNFHLANYKENGAKNWEIEGKKAFIVGNRIKIKGVDAQSFQKDDVIKIKANEANFNKEAQILTLKKDVKLKNKSGATLTTDTLNWEKQKGKIYTSDEVTIRKHEMEIEGKGLEGSTNLKKAVFKENVNVKFSRQGRFSTVTCSGPLEIDYDKGIAVFHKDVVAEDKQGKLFSDKLTVYFDQKGKKLIKMVAQGNVRIRRGDNVTFADKATYFGDNKKIILEGRPRLVFFQE